MKRTAGGCSGRAWIARWGGEKLGIQSEIDWPFGDDQVCFERDLAALGFTVTEEWVHA